MGRIRELDSLRGLAALAVVLHHGIFLSGAIWEERVRSLADTPAFALVHGRGFVIVFFVLSGFVLSRSLASATPSLKVFGTWSAQRAIRLIVPALASVALSAILYEFAFDGSWSHESLWMRQFSWSTSPSVGVILSEGLLLDPATLNNVLWSLIIEVRVTLLIPLMVWFAYSRANQLKLFLLATGLCSLAAGSTPEARGFGDDVLLNLQSVIYLVFPFVLGIILDRSGLYAVRAGAMAQVAALIAVFGLARAPSDAAALLAAVVLIWLVQQPGAIQGAMRTRVPVWFGKISFSLYLVHVPLIVAAFHLFHDRASATLIAVGAIATAIPVAWCFYLVVERPSHRLARAIGPRRPVRSARVLGEEILSAG